MTQSDKDETAVLPTLMGTTKQAVTFNDLWLGDRFQPLYAVGKQYPVYTKIKNAEARCHSLESKELKKKGFGFLGDPVVAVDLNEKVRFIPLD